MRPAAKLPCRHGRARDAACLDQPRIPVGGGLDRELSWSRFAPFPAIADAALLLSRIHSPCRRSFARTPSFRTTRRLSRTTGGASSSMAHAGRRSAAGGGAQSLPVLLSRRTAADAARCLGEWKRRDLLCGSRRC